MPPETKAGWRLIWSGHLTAAENMAVDEAILEAVTRGDVPTTLRIYGWEPPGVSLGYFQTVDERVSLQAIRDRGYGLVRRPTGGRAIIHHHEVTYSVCVRSTEPAGSGSVLQSYREISKGVEAGLALLGIPARIPRQREGRQADKASALPAVCFAKASAGDMTVEGRKIVGSAQLRRGGAVLQHGSIPIRIDLEEHVEILCAADGSTGASLGQAAVGVADALGRDVSFEELGQAVVRGFSHAFGQAMEPAELTAAETARARELVETRYGVEAWNMTPGRRT